MAKKKEAIEMPPFDHTCLSIHNACGITDERHKEIVSPVVKMLETAERKSEILEFLVKLNFEKKIDAAELAYLAYAFGVDEKLKKVSNVESVEKTSDRWSVILKDDPLRGEDKNKMEKKV